jgi:glycosyltransferase involved in cell wall biosynthesis
LKISVITVCYNSAKTLEQTILSVKSQEWLNKEHLIIDGKSNDGTAEILKKYTNDLSYVVSEPDNGIYDAMNKGLAEASGDIICFLNADDYYANANVFSLIINKMMKENLNLVYADAVYFSQKKPNKIKRYYSSKQFTPQKIAFGIMPAHPSVFVKREIMQQTGRFDNSFKIAGDFEYLIRIFKNKNIRYGYISLPLVKMQLGGVSNQSIRNRQIINIELLKACKKNNISTNLFKLLLRYVYKFKEFY